MSELRVEMLEEFEKTGAEAIEALKKISDTGRLEEFRIDIFSVLVNICCDIVSMKSSYRLCSESYVLKANTSHSVWSEMCLYDIKVLFDKRQYPCEKT